MEHNPMKYWKKTISLCFCLLIANMMFVESSSLMAQGQLPVREFTNPDELVTLGSETTFSQTFMILGGFSRRFTDKVLIDRSGRSGPIGFNIPSMHWRQALDYIANAHNLAIQEQSDYVEIIPAPVRSGQATIPTLTGISVEPPMATMDTREIEISAIFFEGNRRQLREIGVDWSAVKDGVVRVSNFAANSVSLNLFQVEMPPQTLSGGYEISAFLNTLELLNVGEILSTPRIKVMDGKEGDIQVGQDFSIKQRDFAGNVTDAFYSTGTILTVTPTIITDSDTSFIFLNIKAERSTATPDPVSTIINKQEAVTQVLLYSGESTVIAGLYETEETEVRRGIPFLKDLPPWFFGLRYLFGYNSVEYTQKELIIVIKADLVPSLRERFNQIRDSKLEVLHEGRRRLLEDTIGNQ